MKNFKKLMALVIAGAMVIGTMSMGASAAPGDLNVNNKLEVSGLDEGDTVEYYQVLQWDTETAALNADANSQNMGWTWGSGIDSTGLDAGTTIAKIAGSKDGAGQITDVIAGDLADNLGTAMSTPVGSVANGKWTVEGVPAGLYMVIVTPAKTGTIYNPIFVAANFYGNGEDPDTSNTFSVVPNESSYYNKGMAKKSTIPLDKTSNGTDGTDGQQGSDKNPAYTADYGEELTFTVTTKIPKFGSNYTKPVFKLQDTLEGLALTEAPKVYAEKKTAEPFVPTTSPLAVAADYDAAQDYVLTDGTVGATKYTVQFTKAYLDSVAKAGQDITIVYKAKVTDDAKKIINQEKNTVDLIFSTTPTDTTGNGYLRDRTNHYTFSIDAGLLGDADGQDSSTEAIKVGRDADGNPVMSMQTYFHQREQHPALNGAEFGLYKSELGAKNETASELYKNDVFPTGKVTSDASGRITIKGLDAGVYWLKELKAPAGFIREQNPIKVEIQAKIKENVEVKDEVVDGTTVKVTYLTNELQEYKVIIGGSTTTYTIENSLADLKSENIKREVSSSDKEIVNTKGVELPSTGGMGTTLFYAIGAILVLGAGILLVSKRRMAAN